MKKIQKKPAKESKAVCIGEAEGPKDSECIALIAQKTPKRIIAGVRGKASTATRRKKVRSSFHSTTAKQHRVTTSSIPIIQNHHES